MTTTYPYAVIKTKESGSVFTGDRQLSTTIVKVFKKDEYKNFSPQRDHLIKNANISKNGDELQVTGEEIFFMTAGLIDKLRFGKRFELFDEIEVDRKWTVADVQQYIKLHTKDKLKLDDSQIKLGYSNFWDLVKRKRTFYIDTTVDVICVFQHTYPKYVQKDKKGFYMDGYYQTTFTTPFKFNTNNYRIEEF